MAKAAAASKAKPTKAAKATKTATKSTSKNIAAQPSMIATATSSHAKKLAAKGCCFQCNVKSSSSGLIPCVAYYNRKDPEEESGGVLFCTECTEKSKSYMCRWCNSFLHWELDDDACDDKNCHDHTFRCQDCRKLTCRPCFNQGKDNNGKLFETDDKWHCGDCIKGGAEDWSRQYREQQCVGYGGGCGATDNKNDFCKKGKCKSCGSTDRLDIRKCAECREVTCTRCAYEGGDMYTGNLYYCEDCEC